MIEFYMYIIKKYKNVTKEIFKNKISSSQMQE